MSQQMSVRRGLSAFATVIALVLLVGAGVGGWALYNMYMPTEKGATAVPVDTEVKSFVTGIEDSLTSIATEPTKVAEETDYLSKLSAEKVGELSKKVSAASPEVKAKIVAMLAEQLPKLQPLIDNAYKVPGVKEKLEPVIAKLMNELKGLGV